MTGAPHKFSKPRNDRADEKAVRNCLSCSRKFMSEWRGDRICKLCKDTRRDHRIYTTAQHEGCALP